MMITGDLEGGRAIEKTGLWFLNLQIHALAERLFGFSILELGLVLLL